MVGTKPEREPNRLLLARVIQIFLTRASKMSKSFLKRSSRQSREAGPDLRADRYTGGTASVPSHFSLLLELKITKSDGTDAVPPKARALFSAGSPEICLLEKPSNLFSFLDGGNDREKTGARPSRGFVPV